MSITERTAGLNAFAWGAAGFSGLTVLCAAAFALTDTMIEGRHAAEKPLKFALSFGVHLATLAFVAAWTLRRSPLFAAGAAVIVGIAFLEFALIGAQALRGIPSHFNVGTPLDSAIFTAMGVGVFIQAGAQLVCAWDLMARPGADMFRARAAGLALACGTFGAMTALAMIAPSEAQIAARAAGEGITAGGRFVGGDGSGAALPFLGWSLEHGDLRVAHFLGVHALQAVLVVALGLAAARVRRAALWLVAAAASYAGVTVVALVQALSGETFATAAPAWLSAYALAALAPLAAAGVARTRPAHA